MMPYSFHDRVNFFPVFVPRKPKTWRQDGRTIYCNYNYVRRQFPTARLGFLSGAITLDRSKYSSLFYSRYDLRRQRPDDIRSSRPPGTRAAGTRTGTRTFALHSWPTSRNRKHDVDAK